MGNILQLNSKRVKTPKKFNKLLLRSTSVYSNRVLFNQQKSNLENYIYLLLSVKFKKKTKLSKMASRIRINFHSDSEAMINKQINMELYASYVYMAMATYFDRDDVALKGFVKRFSE